ncbi:MAG: DUF4301 family protein [Candidatus Sericytochromatia bacterium]|nr:DUF4301 family protein [Candidatus Sericytochromatia bacterium]
MSNSIFNTQDLAQIKSQNNTVEKVTEQIESFKNGFPFINLARPCSVNDGIYIIADSEFDELQTIYQRAMNDSRTLKFVPASGAASRMFKLLQTFNNNSSKINSDYIKQKSLTGDKDCQELEKFILNIKKFAFYDDLANVLKNNGLDIDFLIKNNEYKEIIDYLITDKGLNYENLPKGILKFHKYVDHNRTPFEEHLVEGINYANDRDKVKIHFTLSPEHLDHVQNYIDSVKAIYEDKSKIKFEISYSIQKKSTDTIAVDLDNIPFKDKKENLVFRPGGHGALIENLNELSGDIIFIKNIDNVVPDRLKETTYKFKKALAGYLIKMQDKSFSYLNLIYSKEVNENILQDIFSFMTNNLMIDIPKDILVSSLDNKIDFAYKMLNRPIRVCGMVKNQGEPGGGPFWVKDETNFLSLQIVETSQIDSSDNLQTNILKSSTHFNPVDLICGVRDYQGKQFNLNNFIDYKTGFISAKSKDGKSLKALELPGLWNGAMSDWNTIFIEVPIITFNPVKTVNDLLRNEHQ